MADISYRTEDLAFSYRIAGIYVKNGMVLLQSVGDKEYAFPGGQAEFGENSEDTLKREFMEEMGAKIEVHELKWVAEIFMRDRGAFVHQICLYYLISIDDAVPQNGEFMGDEKMEGREFKIGFEWIPLSDIDKTDMYPPQTGPLMHKLDEGIAHFVDRTQLEI